MLGVLAASTALGHLARFRGTARSRRSAWAGSRATGSSTRPSSSSSSPTIDLVVTGSADSIVMVEGGALEISEKEVLDALKIGAEGHQGADRHRAEGHRQGGQADHGVGEGRAGCGAHQARRGARREGHGQGHQRQGQGRPCRGRRQGQGVRRRAAAGGVPRPGAHHRQRDRGSRIPRHAGPGARQGRAGGRPGHRHRPADQHRDQPAAARARLVALHPRPDAGAGGRDPRHRGRRAAHRQHRRGARDDQVVHAALQLPAVLHRRSAR